MGLSRRVDGVCMPGHDKTRGEPTPQSRRPKRYSLVPDPQKSTHMVPDPQKRTHAFLKLCSNFLESENSTWRASVSDFYLEVYIAEMLFSVPELPKLTEFRSSALLLSLPNG